MGFFSSIRRAVSKATSVAKAVASKASSVAKAVTSGSLADKIKSGVNIVGTNLKNIASKDTLKAFVEGAASGGIFSGLASAGASVAQRSMVELDRSGEFNPDYAYKLGGFSSNEEMAQANALGFENKSDYQAYLASGQGQVVVSPNNGGAGQVVTNGDSTVVMQNQVGTKVVNLGVGNKYDRDTMMLASTVVKNV